ncbi:MAG TPA: GNAT family N-acetyltransferase [Candidatus Limnocylindrales bacterium]|nr:GNAT family N-acetyltransferase [Candidatus Limnocylindrales bacterium]
MNQEFKLAAQEHFPALLAMMREFYAGQHMDFSGGVRDALSRLIADPALGRAYLVGDVQQPMGYFILTFCFSLEFHGRFGLLDELYLRPAFRSKKLGRQVMTFIESACRDAGVEAVRLEAGQENAIAQSLYRSAGFKTEPRRLMTKWL